MAGFLIPFGQMLGEAGAGVAEGKGIQEDMLTKHIQNQLLQQKMAQSAAEFQTYQKQQAALPGALQQFFGDKGKALWALDPTGQAATKYVMGMLDTGRQTALLRSQAVEARQMGDTKRADALDSMANYMDAQFKPGEAGKMSGVLEDPFKSINEQLLAIQRGQAITAGNEGAMDEYRYGLRPTPPVSPTLPAGMPGGLPTGGGGGGGGVSPEISSMISSVAASSGVPEGILRSVVNVESGGNPNAVSPRGAIGLGGVMPATGAAMGYSVPDLFTARKNLEASAKYLSEQYKTFHDWPKALAAYNAGPGRVSSGRPLPAETRAYVPNVMRGVPASSATSASPDLPPVTKFENMSIDQVRDAVGSKSKYAKSVAQAELKLRANKMPNNKEKQWLEQYDNAMGAAKNLEQDVLNLGRYTRGELHGYALSAVTGGWGLPQRWKDYFRDMGAVYNNLWQASKGTGNNGGMGMLHELDIHFPHGANRLFPDDPHYALDKVRGLILNPNIAPVTRQRDAILKKQWEAQHGMSTPYLAPETVEILRNAGVPGY